jgi:hypothetical protein
MLGRNHAGQQWCAVLGAVLRLTTRTLMGFVHGIVGARCPIKPTDGRGWTGPLLLHRAGKSHKGGPVRAG